MLAILPSVSTQPEAPPAPAYERAENAPFLQGIGVGSRVARGKDWRYGDQDGAPGARGTVVELRRWKAAPPAGSLGGSWDGSDASTVGARVLWDVGGAVNTYRWSDPAGEGPRDLDVVGWRAVTPGLLAAVPSYQDALLEGARRQMCPPATTALLRALYRALGGAGWRMRSGWEADAARADAEADARADGAAGVRADGAADAAPALALDNPCTDGWVGVSCRDGAVVGLDLASNLLSLPPRPDGARGELPPELWRLAEAGLHSLRLADNPGLAGAELGRGALCGARALQFLDLSSSGLRGHLPECLGQLAATLETVSLHSNDFEGAVPPSWGALGEARGGRLRMLHLHGNPRLLAEAAPRELVTSGALRHVSGVVAEARRGAGG